MCVKRNFHPVGQGAFYSEKHRNFKVVYDCGNTSKSGFRNEVVAHAFTPDEPIDLLFISHFDYDHVSKIRVLMENGRVIRKVVLPLLHDGQKNLLSNLYRSLGHHVLTLINNPQRYFGPDTVIIEVQPLEENDTPGDANDPVAIESIVNHRQIRSGQPLISNDPVSASWIYVPYNHHFSERSRALLNALTAAGFDINQLRSDPTYTCNLVNHSRRRLRRIYNTLQGTVNQNSLFVYSGPLDNDRIINNQCDNGSLTFSPTVTQPGCIYTGDGDLNKVDIKAVFAPYWDNVGTIQIPHHGACADFNLQTILGNNYYCPVSYGTRNGYGHPCSTLETAIANSASHMIRVTENSGGFMQHICWSPNDPRCPICY